MLPVVPPEIHRQMFDLMLDSTNCSFPTQASSFQDVCFRLPQTSAQNYQNSPPTSTVFTFPANKFQPPPQRPTYWNTGFPDQQPQFLHSMCPPLPNNQPRYIGLDPRFHVDEPYKLKLTHDRESCTEDLKQTQDRRLSLVQVNIANMGAPLEYPPMPQRPQFRSVEKRQRTGAAEKSECFCRDYSCQSQVSGSKPKGSASQGEVKSTEQRNRGAVKFECGFRPCSVQKQLDDAKQKNNTSQDEVRSIEERNQGSGKSETGCRPCSSQNQVSGTKQKDSSDQGEGKKSDSCCRPCSSQSQVNDTKQKDSSGQDESKKSDSGCRACSCQSQVNGTKPKDSSGQGEGKKSESCCRACLSQSQVNGTKQKDSSGKDESKKTDSGFRACSCQSQVNGTKQKDSSGQGEGKKSDSCCRACSCQSQVNGTEQKDNSSQGQAKSTKQRKEAAGTFESCCRTCPYRSQGNDVKQEDSSSQGESKMTKQCTGSAKKSESCFRACSCQNQVNGTKQKDNASQGEVKSTEQRNEPAGTSESCCRAHSCRCQVNGATQKDHACQVSTPKKDTAIGTSCLKRRNKGTSPSTHCTFAEPLTATANGGCKPTPDTPSQGPMSPAQKRTAGEPEEPSTVVVAQTTGANRTRSDVARVLAYMALVIDMVALLAFLCYSILRPLLIEYLF